MGEGNKPNAGDIRALISKTQFSSVADSNRTAYALICARKDITDAALRREALLRAKALLEQGIGAHDLYATYTCGHCLFYGIFDWYAREDALKRGVQLLLYCAQNAYAPALKTLESYCAKRYAAYAQKSSAAPARGPLSGPDGARLTLCEKASTGPIKATLSYENGVNTLLLDVNAIFIYSSLTSPPTDKRAALEAAVLEGFCAWTGEYAVFGGQKLKVEVRATRGEAGDGSFNIVFMDDYACDAMRALAGRQWELLLSTRRTCMSTKGRKWSADGEKSIMLASTTYNAGEYVVKHAAKHEFGHALGIGDLYIDPKAGYSGTKARYRDLEPYRLMDGVYFTVMCNPYAIVTNNDIEMLLLAYRDNAKQLYQPREGETDGSISSALNNGN